MKKRSPLRQKQILELKAVVDTHPGWNKEQLVFEMLRYRNTISDGVSIREIAVVLYPDKVIRNKKGEIIAPTHEAIENTSSVVERVRGWFNNESVVPHAATNQNSESVLYNFQTKKELDKLRKIRKAKKEGMDNREVKELKILLKRTKNREISADQLVSQIERTILIKKRKRGELEITQ